MCEGDQQRTGIILSAATHNDAGLSNMTFYSIDI
jgi:hypothetical protein